jgi:hypothetical protein
MLNVIDNQSSHGSAEFFEADRCQVFHTQWLLVSFSRIVE